MSVDISVVVPVLNARQYLERCLENLRNQTLDANRYEIVIVDNGSTDGSYDTVMSDSRLRVLRETRRDPYLARNTGVATSNGSVIAFTDAHCIADLNWLHHLWHEFFIGGADFVAGALGYPEEASRTLQLYGAYHRTKMAYIYREEINPSMFCHAANIAVRKSLFEDIGCFHPLPIPGDTDLVHRIRQEYPHATVTYSPRALVHRQSVRTLMELHSKTIKHAALNHTMSTRGNLRALSSRRRVDILLLCKDEYSLSILHTLWLSGTLIIGVFLYEILQLNMRLSKSRSHKIDVRQ